MIRKKREYLLKPRVCVRQKPTVEVFDRGVAPDNIDATLGPNIKLLGREIRQPSCGGIWSEGFERLRSNLTDPFLRDARCIGPNLVSRVFGCEWVALDRIAATRDAVR